MKLFKSALMGAGAAIVGTVGAQAADLPTRKSAPVEYVRICDAYGAGFFYIPGTDTCLKIGGVALAEARALTNQYVVFGYLFEGVGTAKAAAGNLPPTSSYINARGRDDIGYSALGRVELDARNQTAWGTLRAFIRVDAYYGAGSTAGTGSFNPYGGLNNYTVSTGDPRETTIVNKAFIQFAGLTAGRAQSFFDFYADAYNWELLRGSNATSTLFAYTGTFGGGFSATISAEDPYARRNPIGTTIGSTTAYDGGSKIPDIIGNIRVDQPWGAAQVSAALHQVNSTLYSSLLSSSFVTGTPLASYGFPLASQNDFGFAVQGGLQFNLPMFAPGDKLWLQGTYEQGAYGFISGNNLSFAAAPVQGDRYYGGGAENAPYLNGWMGDYNMDCVFTGGTLVGGTVSGSHCEKTWGFAVTSAFKHYWIPSVSQAFFVSYYENHYSNAALAGTGAVGAPGVGGGAVGPENEKELRVGTNLVWTPIPGFDIGGEFDYIHTLFSRPVGLAPDAALVAAGLPAFQSNQNTFEGRIRVQRAF